MIVAGLGCMKDCPVDDVLAALGEALNAEGLTALDLSALATGPQKAGETGLKSAANKLALPLRIATPNGLEAAAPYCLTTSSASLTYTGLPSLCEAAALAIAGPGSQLLGPRIKHMGVTSALARSETSS